MEKTEAILIGRTRFSESSLIVHWCSPDFGLFRTIAKGALRAKSPLGAQLDLFVSVDMRFNRSKASDLHTLTEVHWTQPRLGLRASYGRVLAATYLVKLLTQTAEPNTPIPALYQLLAKALDYLAAHEPTVAVLERYELRLAEDLGLVGTAGARGQEAAMAIEDAFHKRLPVQRQQVLEWIAAHARGSDRNEPL